MYIYVYMYTYIYMREYTHIYIHTYIYRVGTWVQGGSGFALCGDDPTLQSRVTGDVYLYVYFVKTHLHVYTYMHINLRVNTDIFWSYLYRHKIEYYHIAYVLRIVNFD
jgi:hypothetical protein